MSLTTAASPSAKDHLQVNNSATQQGGEFEKNLSVPTRRSSPENGTYELFDSGTFSPTSCFAPAAAAAALLRPRSASSGCTDRVTGTHPSSLRKRWYETRICCGCWCCWSSCVVVPHHDNALGKVGPEMLFKLCLESSSQRMCNNTSTPEPSLVSGPSQLDCEDGVDDTCEAEI